MPPSINPGFNSTAEKRNTAMPVCFLDEEAEILDPPPGPDEMIPAAF